MSLGFAVACGAIDARGCRTAPCTRLDSPDRRVFLAFFRFLMSHFAEIVRGGGALSAPASARLVSKALFKRPALGRCLAMRQHHELRLSPASRARSSSRRSARRPLHAAKAPTFFYQRLACPSRRRAALRSQGCVCLRAGR